MANKVAHYNTGPFKFYVTPEGRAGMLSSRPRSWSRDRLRPFFGGLGLVLEGLVDYIVQEAAKMPPQPQSMSSHDAVSPSDGDIANSAPPPKKPVTLHIFVSYTKKIASALVAQPVPLPLRCNLVFS